MALSSRETYSLLYAPAEIQRTIDHACHIDKVTFKVLVIILACLAVIASISRLLLRVRTDRRLLIEDWLVLFATICLIAETGCVYHFSPVLYLIDAATMKPIVYSWLRDDSDRWVGLSSIGPAWLDAYLTLAWAAVFSVKFSFLTLFYRMIRGVKKSLTRYFWVTVIATAVAGIIVIAESFFSCPHFGSAAARCFTEDKYTFSLKTGILCQCLDIVTDIMIVSIPIILLRMAQLRCDHKLRMGAVLCLSCTCIILSAARLIDGIHTNIKGVLQFGTVWISFMLHAEAAVAVMTGSVPALRAIYRTHQKRRTVYASTTQLKDLENSAGNDSQQKTDNTIQHPPKTLIRLSRDLPRRSTSRIRHSLSNFQLPPLRGIRRHSHALGDQQQHSRSASSASVVVTSEEAPLAQAPQLNEIRITYECTVVSEEASLHDLPDFSEVGRQEWVWAEGTAEEEAPSSTTVNKFVNCDRMMDIDPSLLGKINSGMMM